MKALFLHADFDPKPEYVLDKSEQETHIIKTSNMVWRNPRPELIQAKEPGKPGPRDVKIHVRACGICGSDLHYVETDKEGYMLFPGRARPNCIAGHEFAGEIVEVGSEVTDFKVGDLVAPEMMVWCGECVHCRAGFFNQCVNMRELGVTEDGGFATYAIAPARVCWKIDSLRDVYKTDAELFEAGALIEPSSVAYYASFIAGGGIQPGAIAVIYGAGPIGLLCASMLKIAGASKVIMFEISEGRRQLAKKMGADICIDPTIYKSPAEQVAAIMEMTDGLGADFQLECAGVAQRTMPIITEVLGVGSTVVMTAWGAGDTGVFLPKFQLKKAKLTGSYGECGNHVYQYVIRLMASGKFDPRPIVSERFKIDDIMEAFEVAMKRVAVKVMINDLE